MNQEKFESWLETKIVEVLQFDSKNEIQSVYIQAATTAMKEILDQVKLGRFN